MIWYVETSKKKLLSNIIQKKGDHDRPSVSNVTKTQT